MRHKMQKTCTKCGETFPATSEYFHKHPKQSSGLHPRCKVCRKKERADRYKISGEKEREQMRNYARTHSEESVNRVKEFRIKNPNYRCEFRIKHLDAIRKSGREYVKNHLDMFAIRSRNRRARIKNCPGIHTGKDIENILIQQSGRCFYCGNPLYKYQVDHVIPIVLGGSNSPDNLVLACPHCNKSKGGRLPEDWIQNPIN